MLLLKIFQNLKTKSHQQEHSASCMNWKCFLDHGLIKGGDISNAIVYVDKDLTPDTTEKLKKAFGKDNVSIRPNGILDNLNLNYPNEAARQ